MTLIYDISLLVEPWKIHWLPIAIGLGALAVSLVKRSDQGMFDGAELSWLALAVWALQANTLVYQASESPHLMENLGGLLVTSQEMIGSFLVLGGLVLLEMVGILVRRSGRSSLRPNSTIRLLGVRNSVLFLIVLQVFLNWWITDLAWWGFSSNLAFSLMP
jgi:hypothetical protein